MSHTPGPWFSYSKEGYSSLFIGSPTHDVAEVTHAGGNREAKARLIAAAPELLAALLEMRDAFTSDGTDIQHNACRMADAAIQKAGGE